MIIVTSAWYPKTSLVSGTQKPGYNIITLIARKLIALF